MIHLHEGRSKLNLNGLWKYKLDQNDIGVRQSYYLTSNDFSHWKDMPIPSNWYLIEEIGDYFGTIWYERTFEVPTGYKGQRLFLRFGAVDYYAEVWLNDHYLGFHEGMFNPFEFDVTDKLNYDGENILVVRDSSPKDNTEYILADPESVPVSTPYKQHQAKSLKLIKGHMIDAMHRPGSMTSFRQDGNSGGVWGDVELIARPEVYIDYVKVYTKIVLKKDWLGDMQDKPDGTGLASFDVTVFNASGKLVKTSIDIDITPYNFASDEKHSVSRKVVVYPGDNTFKVAITLPDVKLWWTWDHGHPNMYTAAIKVETDSISQNFGVKEVRTDADGQWYLNNKKIFLRGMRYISSLWMSEANEDMWRPDLEKMLDMDINSIRIGSHVEKDGFYTLCDELGLLLWQVFPLHYCVSDDDDVIERASEMIRDMGMMLHNHACLGMWSVYKEPEIYKLDDKPNNYFRLCEVLKETLGNIDPIRWIHKGDYREGVLNIMIGSCKDGDQDILTTKIEPNIVEFGADSVPCLDTLKKFIPEDKLWPPDWDTWEYWGLFYRNQFKRGRVEMGTSLEEFIHNTQAYEALVVKEQIEALRQRKYRPVSTMYLYYWSDACPIMGSGLLDYYRRPYEVYESMKGVYTQVLVSLEWNKDPYIVGREKKYRWFDKFIGKLWLNNDHFHAVEDATISWKIVKKDNGEVMLSKSFTATLEPDSAKVLDSIEWILPGKYLGFYTIEMQVTDKDGNVLSTNSTDIKACY